MLTPQATKITNKAPEFRRSPVLKNCAQANATVVQHGRNCGQPQPDNHVRQINRPSCNAVELALNPAQERCKRRFSHRNCFPGTDDEVSQHHHPSRGKADRSRKNFCGVSHFAGSVRHGHHQLAVDIADREQAERRRLRIPERRPAGRRAAASRPSPPASPRRPSCPTRGRSNQLRGALRARVVNWLFFLRNFRRQPKGRSKASSKTGTTIRTTNWPPATK